MKQTRQTDILVIGAGPAGLSAAAVAAEYGADVIVVDENGEPGGQLFKQIHKFFGSKDHQASIRGYDIGYSLFEKVRSLGVEVLLNTVAYGIFPEGVRLILSNERELLISAKRIILATGASENPLSFSGSTLPGVVGAGAIQTMINLHRVPVGQNVLMIGSGNVGLIVSYQLLQAGLSVIGVVEAMPEIGGYGVHASKIRRAGVPIYTSHTILAALPNKEKTSVQEAILTELDDSMQPISGKEKSLKVDTIALSVGLTPMVELAYIAGVTFTYLRSLGGHVPLHDENLMTTVPGLYVAGDIAGIEEASTALEEGRLAGLSAADSLKKVDPDQAARERCAIHNSLSHLRKGPFGWARARAKEEIVRQMRDWRIEHSA